MLRRIAQACLLALVIGPASVVGAQSAAVGVPENLRVPEQNVRHVKTYARGVQVYVCQATADTPDAFGWTLKAPVAELWNDLGERVGTHYAGPTWEATDGSKVVGQVVERASAPNADSISWLLLQATSHHGNGTFAPVTYVQRLETTGGVAPADGCDPSTAGLERDVGYAATYVFFSGRDGAR